MLKSSFKIAFRYLFKHKAHSLINISGLAIGMAVALLIGLLIFDELTFDRNNPLHSRIGQVMQTQQFAGEISTDPVVPIPLADAIRREQGSNFQSVLLSSFTWSHILSDGNKQLLNTGNFMQPFAPELLDLKMIYGSRSGLKDPASIFLSQSVARAVFGDTNPLGKTLLLDNKMPVKVSGVYEDIAQNSSFRDLRVIMPWDLYYAADDGTKTASQSWYYNSYQIYVLLAPGMDMASVSAKIKNIKLNHVGKDEARFKASLFLAPMDRWHLYSEYKNGVQAGGRIQYVWLFGIIGIFVLLLACINFMNLSTARSEKRAREVGIRKTIGSSRAQLITQFFGESMLMTALAFILSVALVRLALPAFNDMAGKNMSILWTNPWFWLLGIGFCCFTGLLAGSYPALYLSSFRPVKVLKGVFRAGPMASLPRKVLVVLQFTVSIMLIIGTIIVFRQIQFARNKDLGYNKNGLISMEMYPNEMEGHFPAFRDDLIKTGMVSDASESQSNTSSVNNNNSGFSWKGKDPSAADMFGTVGVDGSYGKTVGWQFVSGRDFSPEFATDSNGMILNEASVKYMGLKNPVGELVRWNHKDFHVIGVVKNMVVESPYEPTRQAVYFLDATEANYINIRIKSGVPPAQALARIESIFKNYAPAIPFDYRFADREYAQKFIAEQRVGKLSAFFSALAIFISCLGLFGMASFMAEQRTMEIGVRKVLGASILNLWGLLSKEFVFLILISLIIAIPASYYFMHHWLQNYTYRSDMSWWIFAITAAGSIGITLLTVSYQAIRAALANPVRSLRSE